MQKNMSSSHRFVLNTEGSVVKTNI